MNKKQRQTLERMFEKPERSDLPSSEMEYKGYFAKVEFDECADIFHGEVINLRDFITFEGETVEELRQAFRDSGDDYLEFCAERGENPEKPYSGKFMVRVEPELHERIAIEARERGVSINSLVGEALSRTIDESARHGAGPC